ncbi:SOS response-associated peptidase [Vibrio ulleungensis]|uniref:Abasic site processing protein n=1 Tax=Vibrio ulleungensis TaxID=2807619 RepID=A0ABS2HD67_9VIBR|nr:SOS response-associated peptidase family protein [Vibrio ulleungensis]MBM7034939.1 SOS response-associated peptidase family protein [Vibrio ulleungensis]
MCGRLNIIADPLAQLVSETLGIEFWTTTNHDVRPTQSLSVVSASSNHSFEQTALGWGVQPAWSSKLLINAKSETVASKSTFKYGFAHSPVVVPCSGWYEWSTQQGVKQKFLFEGQSPVLYMAGVVVDGNVVTLTRSPTEQCSHYHHRMPLILHHDQITPWVLGTIDERAHLLNVLPDEEFIISNAEPPAKPSAQMSLF